MFSPALGQHFLAWSCVTTWSQESLSHSTDSFPSEPSIQSEPDTGVLQRGTSVSVPFSPDTGHTPQDFPGGHWSVQGTGGTVTRASSLLLCPGPLSTGHVLMASPFLQASGGPGLNHPASVTAQLWRLPVQAGAWVDSALLLQNLTKACSPSELVRSFSKETSHRYLLEPEKMVN
ncbi:Hypothetical predicted protein [Marmota monax]|uniref:Uncharacterized protein n=1 Tax=Marmota monax TaxID=9995 RepID=A0A5E4BWT8_MARMO|nr:hypothetical protein GHT09_007325 [Marmota monax]VTJ73706.1 Hypothetical predicted protein [Marmota monax]